MVHDGSVCIVKTGFVGSVLGLRDLLLCDYWDRVIPGAAHEFSRFSGQLIAFVLLFRGAQLGDLPA